MNILVYKPTTYPWIIYFSRTLLKKYNIKYATNRLNGTWQAYSNFSIDNLDVTLLMKPKPKFRGDILGVRGFIKCLILIYRCKKIILFDICNRAVMQAAILSFIFNKQVYFIISENRRYRIVPNESKWKKIIISKLIKLEKLLFLYSKMIIAESLSTKNDLLYLLPRLESKIKVIPHGTDISYFTPRKPSKDFLLKYNLNIREDEVVFLFSGGFYIHKGIMIILKILSEYQFNNAKFIILGYGERFVELKEIFEKLSNVVILPLMNHDEMPDLYNASDVFLLPSLETITDAERSPNALVEAMASGLACITTRTGGIPSYIEDSGIYISASEFENIKKIFDTLISDKTFLNKLKYNARKRAEEFLDINKYTSEIEKIITN